MQPRRLRCVLRRGAQSGYGRVQRIRYVVGAHDRSSWRSASFERFRFPGAWSKERAFLRGTARSASRRWAATVLPPMQSWCSWESMTTDGEAQKPRLPLVRGQFPRNRAENEAERRVAGRAEEGAIEGFAPGVFFYAFAHSRTLSRGRHLALHALSRARCGEKRPDVCMETSGCAARVV